MLVKKVLRPNEHQLSQAVGKPRAQNYQFKIDPLLRAPNSLNNTRKHLDPIGSDQSLFKQSKHSVEYCQSFEPPPKVKVCELNRKRCVKTMFEQSFQHNSKNKEIFQKFVSRM